MTDVANRLAPSAQKLLERSLREALSCGKNAIESEHIALALARGARANEQRVAEAYDLIAAQIGGRL